MITQSCICPGFSTMVSNLLRSYAPPDDISNDPMDEYKLGMGNEVYLTKDLSPFEGMSFSQATNVRKN